ncbi:Phosphate transport system permease protein PstC (TC 3.A.1.7.1), partial [Pseudomonas sp. FEN]
GQGLFGLSPRATGDRRARWQDPAVGPRQPAPGSVLERAVEQGLVRDYDEPKYVWQSTAANTDFEPKL